MKLNLLLVDDYPSIRTMIKAHLKNLPEGAITFFDADNVLMALDVINKNEGTDEQINYIITDWNMPDYTGLDLVKKVREMELYKNIPILILTSEKEKDLVVETLQAGASHFLFKPWSEEDLKSKLIKAWEKHQK